MVSLAVVDPVVDPGVDGAHRDLAFVVSGDSRGADCGVFVFEC